MENHKAKLEAEVRTRIGWHDRPFIEPVRAPKSRTRHFPPLRRKGRLRPPGAAFRETVVYFLLSEDNLVKIGTTIHMRRRFEQLANGMEEGMFSVLAFVPGDRVTEQRLHARFKAHWVEGEWFRAAPEILDLATGLRALYPYLKAYSPASGS